MTADGYMAMETDPTVASRQDKKEPTPAQRIKGMLFATLTSGKAFLGTSELSDDVCIKDDPKLPRMVGTTAL
jgi:hypothetical protein